MYAALENARGDPRWPFLRRGNLQTNPPSLLPEMYALIKNDGYDSVATRRSTRKGEPNLRSFFARVFYKLMNRISKTQRVDEGARDFRLMTRQMVDSVLSVCEYNRFTKGIFTWVGYKTRWIEYENVERVAGETKWSFWEAVQIFFTMHYWPFLTVPLALSSFFGILFSLIAVIGIVFVIVRQAVWGGSAYGLGLDRLHHPVCCRHPAFLHRYSRPISCQNLSGNQKTADIHSERNRKSHSPR